MKREESVEIEEMTIEILEIATRQQSQETNHVPYSEKKKLAWVLPRLGLGTSQSNAYPTQPVTNRAVCPASDA